jgi:hypothetical protein
MMGYLKEKAAAQVYKTEVNGRGVPERWPRDTFLSAKVFTKIRRLAAVDQYV